VAGDYDGDGKPISPSIAPRPGISWFILPSTDRTMDGGVVGISTDIPVAA
jgi:hypothetical protein